MSRRPYIRPVARTRWWMSQPRYLRYMVREISSGFIGAYTIVLAVGLLRLSQGAEAWSGFVAALLGPVGVVFALVTLVIAVYHTVTWFQVTPKAMPLVVQGKRVPGAMIIGAHWVASVLASAIIWLAATLPGA